MISDDLTQIRERIDEIVDFSRDVVKELNELKLTSDEYSQRIKALETEITALKSKKK